ARFIVLVFALLALACAPEPLPLDATVYVSPLFAAEDAATVVQSLDEWSAATSGMVALRPIMGAGFGGLTIMPGLAGGGAALGEYRRASRLITLDVPRMRTANIPLLTVALHELGHALGLPHADDGLMNASKARPCIDAAT